MITDFIRLATMLFLSGVAGVLGLIWLFGEHASIWVTVGVKPFAVLLLAISYILYSQVKREVRRIERRETHFRDNRSNISTYKTEKK